MSVVINRVTTNRFLGLCTPCKRPHAVETDQAATGQKLLVDCPECAKPVTLERLVAVTTMDACDPSCMGATGPNCSCGCGGANHGGAYVATHTHYEVEKAVKKYRATSAKRSEAAKKAAATKAEKKAANKQMMIDGWFAGLNEAEAAAIAWILEDGEVSGFLADMRYYVRRFKNGNGKYAAPLTSGQLAAVVKCHVRELEWAARQAERAAEAAEAAPVPLGSGLTVEGEIVHVKTQDGFAYNSIEHKMLIKGEGGWKVWATVPRSLLPSYYNGEEFQAALKGLVGQRVRLVANVELGRDQDPAFGIAKRPRRAELVAGVNA